MDIEKMLRDARQWADTAEQLAADYQDEERMMEGHEWVALNHLAQDLRTFANDLQQEVS